jgi:uncharacterized protein (DUF2147 family)
MLLDVFIRRTVGIGRLAAVGAASAVLLSVAPAKAQNAFYGDWKTPAGATVRIERCGSSHCGRLIRFRPPPGYTMQNTLDTENRDASKRGRKVLGLNILYRLKPAGDTLKGRAYDPRRGISANATVSVASPNALTVKGCLRVVVRLCEKETWRRVR